MGMMLVLAALTAAAGEDRILETTVESQKVKVQLLIPAESRPVRGILVHAVHYTMKTTGRWPTLCRELKFAHLVTTISLKLNNRPRRLAEAMKAALKEFADEARMPELLEVPRVGVGMSAGGMCIPMLLGADPDKVLTNAVSCSWVTDPEKIGPGQAAIPEMYVIGAKPDGFKMLPAIDTCYVPAVKAGRPWALGLQHGCKHDWANSGTLFVPWIRGIAKLRIPEGVTPGDPVPLKEVDFNGGWRGDRSTINAQFATVTPASEYAGTPENVVWLPDRATACVWRAWQTKDSPVHLTAEAADGSVRLPGFNPRKSFGISVAPGVPVKLGLDVKDGLELSGVKFFHEDVEIGEGPAMEWTPAARRAYAVWARYEVGGRPAVTNPALICVENATSR